MELDAPKKIVATVYAVLTEFSIVRLRCGDRLYAFGPAVSGAPDISGIKVGATFVLTIGPRLNNVIEVAPAQQEASPRL